MKVVVLLIVTLMACEECSVTILNFTDAYLADCTSYSDDFWDIYDHHFYLVDRLKIHILKIDKHKPRLNLYADFFLKSINSYDYFLALEMQETLLDETVHYQERVVSDTSESVSEVQQKLEPMDHDKLMKVKLLSSDSLNGFFIIVWDVQTLHHFLDQDFQSVIPEQRATYALQFISYSTERCKTIRNEIGSILRRLWTEHNVFNVVAQTPCSCDSKHIYIYRPFIRIRGSWGLTESFSFEEVTRHFRTITNSLNNLNKYPLNISMFSKPPYLVLELPKLLRGNPIYTNLSASKGFAGADALLLGTIAKYLNFEVNLVGNTNESYLGIVQPNGTVPPSALKDAIEGRAIYGANRRYLTDQHQYQSKIEYTVPHASEYLCLVVPKAHKVPNWKSLFRCFTKWNWVLIVGTCIVCTTFWYYIAHKRDFKKTSWTMFSYLLGIPERIVPKKSQFIFLTACMFFNIVILGIVQGSMFKSFSISVHYPDINTLEDFINSDLPIATAVWSLIKDDSPMMVKIQEKTIKRIRNPYDKIALYRNFCTTDARSHAAFIIKTQLVDADGSPLLHIVPQCFNTFLMSHLMPKGSAFLTIFNHVITRVFESGLTEKWSRDVIDSVIAERMISRQRNHQSTKAFSLYDLKIAFYVLLVGHVCSFVLFFFEILSKRK